MLASSPYHRQASALAAELKDSKGNDAPANNVVTKNVDACTPRLLAEASEDA